jgi:predicted acetyltransferase
MAEEVRPLREPEYDAYFNMTAQAFRANRARARRGREWTKDEELRGLFDNGQLQVGLKIIDLPIWMGQTALQNGAITGVASPPESRRRGYIGKLLHATLEELREKNVPIATLYPFSFPFYKRFGWEQVETKLEYKVPVERFPFSDVGGRWEPISRSTDFDKQEPEPVSDENLAALMGVYNRWCVGRTGPLARDEHFWRRGKLQQGAEQRPDVYLWRNDEGAPRAYVIYAFEELQNQWVRRLVVWDQAALDTQAFKALLGFLRNHDSQAKEVGLWLPSDLPFLPLFDDPEFETKVEPGFMLRLVDVGNALSARSYDTGANDALNITVKDSFCEWNNGTYTLEVANGKGEARKISDHEAKGPHISLDQKVLAQLFTGFLTASEAESIGLLHATDKSALQAADAIFKAPRPFMPDGF